MNPFIVPLVALSAVSIIFIVLSEDDSPAISTQMNLKHNKVESTKKSIDEIKIDYSKSKKISKAAKKKKPLEDKRNYLITEENSKNGIYHIRVYSSSINSTKVSGDITIHGLIGNEEYKLIIPANIKNSIKLVVTDTILDSTYEVPFDFKKLKSGKLYQIDFEFNQLEKIIEEEIGLINNIPNPFN